MYKRQTSLGVHTSSSGKCWSAFWCVRNVSSAVVAWVRQESRVWLSGDVNSFGNALHVALWLRHSYQQHDEVPGTSVQRKTITNSTSNFQSVTMSLTLRRLMSYIQDVRKRLYHFLFFFLGAQCVESGVSCTDCY